jgi:predicted permease
VMRWIYKLPLRFRSLFRNRQVEKELSDELRFHLEELTKQNVAKGMASEEARYAALRELGNVEQIKEECREMRRVNFIETFLQDLRYGLRQLRRTPGLAAAVVLSPALGIGANTAIFSLMDAVMLRNLSVKKPEQLVLLQWATLGRQWAPDPVLSSLHGDMWRTRTGGMASPSFSYPAFQEFRARNKVFSNAFGFQSAQRLNMNVSGHASLADGEMVTGDYFSGLGVSPVLGRATTDADEKTGATPIAVISYGLWKSQFGGSSAAVGKTVTLNGVPFTIVGVAPSEFFGVQPGSKLDIWVPISTQPQILPQWNRAGESWFTERKRWWVVIMGRLKPGVSSQQALAAMSLLFTQSMTAGLNPPPKAQMLPRIELTSASQGPNDLRKQFSKPLWVLMALVGLVLLIACANVANLLLARATTRRREIAVRLALGAGRRRLVRQLLTEGILLAVMGGLMGLLFAFWGTHILLALMASGRSPVRLVVRPDLAVLSFTAAASLITGILFGLVPALRATRIDLTPALKENAGTASADLGTKSKLNHALVVAQVAGCLLLLTGAGLFVRTLENLENQNLGFNQYHLLLFKIDPTQAGYKSTRLANFYQQLLAGIQALPGVRSASFSSDGLIGAGFSVHGISIEGYAPKQGGKGQSAWTNSVGPDFFKTTGINVLLGRAIGAEDTENSPKLAVMNEALVRHIFGKANPVGHRFGFGNATSSALEYDIVGVVQNAKYEELREPAPPTVYIPYRQRPTSNWSSAYFEVRTAGDPLAMVPALRRAVRGLSKDVPLSDVRTESQKIDQVLMQERLFACLSGFFGGLALLLACLGVYGVMSYSVARRTGEIGIRVALGAQRRDILGMVLRETVVLALAGVAIGVPVALVSTRWISSFLFGLEPDDPITIATAAGFMVAVALFSGYWPARRASRVDPLVALRYE